MGHACFQSARSANVQPQRSTAIVPFSACKSEGKRAKNEAQGNCWRQNYSTKHRETLEYEHFTTRVDMIMLF
eukprot:1884140-Amphidinium_carterae.1